MRREQLTMDRRPRPVNPAEGRMMTSQGPSCPCGGGNGAMIPRVVKVSTVHVLQCMGVAASRASWYDSMRVCMCCLPPHCRARPPRSPRSKSPMLENTVVQPSFRFVNVPFRRHSSIHLSVYSSGTCNLGVSGQTDNTLHDSPAPSQVVKLGLLYTSAYFSM